MRSGTRLGTAVPLTLLLALLSVASPADASVQGGLRDRLTRTVGAAARDLTDRVQRHPLPAPPVLTQQPSRPTRECSLLAGTWRVTYVVSGRAGSDSVTVYARTFERPDVGTVGDPGPGMEQGHLLTAITAWTERELPADRHAAGDRRDAFGGGPITVMPISGAGPASSRRFHTCWPLTVPASTGAMDRFSRRVIEQFHSGDRIVTFDGRELTMRSPRSERVTAEVTTAGAATVRYQFKREDETLSIHAVRVSSKAYSNESRVKVPGVQ